MPLHDASEDTSANKKSIESSDVIVIINNYNVDEINSNGTESNGLSTNQMDTINITKSDNEKSNVTTDINSNLVTVVVNQSVAIDVQDEVFENVIEGNTGHGCVLGNQYSVDMNN